MALTAHDILALPAEKRRKLKLGKKRRRYRKENRPRRSKGELVAFLRENDFRSSRQLEAGRKPGEPNTNDFRKEFGSWQNALDSAFTDLQEVRFTPEYMAKSVLEFGLWTCLKYLAARAARPDVIPSMYRVKQQWGYFSNLKEFAVRMSIAETLNRYITLYRKLGRIPTM